jgi:hypothetical protein
MRAYNYRLFRREERGKELATPMMIDGKGELL